MLNTDNDANRRFVELCYRTTSTLVNPIVDWSTADVWEFLHHYGCQSNPLYQCSQNRIGCIGCPMQSARGMKKDFARYPAYEKLYIKAFEKMLIARSKAGKTIDAKWQTGNDVMKWWVGDNPLQLSFLDYDEEYEI